MENHTSELYKINELHIPRYNELPNIGLYLKQVVILINEELRQILSQNVTETMLSNYIKMHLVSSPIKKLYNREQIARLIFIVLVKPEVSLDNIQYLFTKQEAHWTAEESYNFFCNEYENTLLNIFGKRENSSVSAVNEPSEKMLLRNVIAANAHRLYLEYCFTQEKSRNT